MRGTWALFPCLPLSKTFFLIIFFSLIFLAKELSDAKLTKTLLEGAAIAIFLNHFFFDSNLLIGEIGCWSFPLALGL